MDWRSTRAVSASAIASPLIIKLINSARTRNSREDNQVSDGWDGLINITSVAPPQDSNDCRCAAIGAAADAGSGICCASTHWGRPALCAAIAPAFVVLRSWAH